MYTCSVVRSGLSWWVLEVPQLGEIGIGARKDLEAALDRRVHLILEVKVASQ